MASVQHIYPTEEDRAEDLERERRARGALDHLVTCLAEYPRVWQWGDGRGGAIMRDLDDRLAAIGLSRTDAGFKSRTPARKALTATMKLAMLKRDGYRCVHCGSQEDLTADHVVAVIKGGTNAVDNLQTLCGTCNTSKGAKSMHDWLASR